MRATALLAAILLANAIGIDGERDYTSVQHCAQCGWLLPTVLTRVCPLGSIGLSMASTEFTARNAGRGACAGALIFRWGRRAAA
jgi:hypothetical protein